MYLTVAANLYGKHFFLCRLITAPDELSTVSRNTVKTCSLLGSLRADLQQFDGSISRCLI